MARAYCFASTNGDNASTMISRRLEALERFGCEGTVYHVNRSCKVMDCQMMEVQRQLSKKAGVPYTSFDGDQADYRNYSEAQFETRIQVDAGIRSSRSLKMEEVKTACWTIG